MPRVNVIAEGDQVAAYLIFEGIHARKLDGIPASGRKVRFALFMKLTLKDGLIIEKRAFRSSQHPAADGRLTHPPGRGCGMSRALLSDQMRSEGARHLCLVSGACVSRAQQTPAIRRPPAKPLPAHYGDDPQPAMH